MLQNHTLAVVHFICRATKGILGLWESFHNTGFFSSTMQPQSPASCMDKTVFICIDIYISKLYI